MGGGAVNFWVNLEANRIKLSVTDNSVRKKCFLGNLHSSLTPSHVT